MGKIKKALFSIVSVVAEYITLVVTIVASTYIVVSSQYKQYSLDVLILWIISLLGLIAVAIASEKFFTLKKIERQIEKVDLLQNGVISLDHVFSKRKSLAPIESRMKNATSLIITGGSLARLSDEYYGFFEQKLREGCEIEIIMTKPDCSASKQLCLNVVYETSDINLYNRKINESLQRFIELQKINPKIMKIYLSEKTPPFSIIAMNLGKGDSFIHVELYSYAVPTRERLEFKVTKEDVDTYKFFSSQIDVLKDGLVPFEQTT